MRNIKKRNRVDTCYKNMFTAPPYQSRELLKRALCRYRHTNPVSHAIGETRRLYSVVLTLDLLTRHHTSMLHQFPPAHWAMIKSPAPDKHITTHGGTWFVRCWRCQCIQIREFTQRQLKPNFFENLPRAVWIGSSPGSILPPGSINAVVPRFRTLRIFPCGFSITTAAIRMTVMVFHPSS